MKKVITYGTYDLLHYGHIRLLERAKELGDYLIVGVTSEDFDKKRGKINVKQSLMERVKAVKDTGLADEIIIEEYEGQKIDDICKYGIDIFTVGSDWKGKFDYLEEYCKVVYLPRTEGISSSDLRTEKRKIKLGLVGNNSVIEKMIKESNFVNGLEATEMFVDNPENMKNKFPDIKIADSYEDMIKNVDAVYLISHPKKHYEQIKKAILLHKNVLCESPISLSVEDTRYLMKLAEENECVLMETVKTAYATAYSRLLLLLKSGAIGDIVSIDSTCTSLRIIENDESDNIDSLWNSICAWGPTALLPVFQMLGTNYEKKSIVSKCFENDKKFDLFTKIDFIYNNAVASIKVGKGVKSEGDLVITGTKGYVYVPAPWWKTDYFEIRYENQTENKRYFYQLEGEGIRNELLVFTKSVEEKRNLTQINENITMAIGKVIEDFENKIDMTII
ncbi:MAG: adenylyltransferase/cytidyltransferase family protein [Clostridia bacterium]|nr:adenylyltransferase/cytidyltransferase family protein [Clostridia bacterium]